MQTESNETIYYTPTSHRYFSTTKPGVIQTGFHAEFYQHETINLRTLLLHKGINDM